MNKCYFCTTVDHIEGMWEIASPTDNKTIWVCYDCLTAENINDWLGDKFAHELAGGTV